MELSKPLDLVEIAENCIAAALGNQEAVRKATESLATTTTKLTNELPDPIAEKVAAKLAAKLVAPIKQVAEDISNGLSVKIQEVKTQADAACQAYEGAARKAQLERGLNWSVVVMVVMVALFIFAAGIYVGRHL